ncbi:MAG: DUF3574 domain-containing protein [Candidatus Methylacidiphilales bacterium]
MGLMTVAVIGLGIGCAGPGQAKRSELYFGLSRPDGGVVSSQQWEDFVDDEIVARFPDGFTVIPAEGAWRVKGEEGTRREPTRILVVIHPGDKASSVCLEALRSAYRRRFGQQSVLRVDSPVVADF